MCNSLLSRTLRGVIPLIAVYTAVAVPAATIWNGPDTNFTQTATVTSDFLTSHAIITRGGNGPIYNSVYESFGTKGLSPTNTEWATGTLANYNTLVYKDFISWANSPFNTAAGILNKQAVCHIKSDDIYFSVKFTAWGRFGAGGFAYTRSTGVAAAPTPTISITGPAGGAIYSAPATIHLTANASVSSGTVTNVSFFRGTTFIGSTISFPFVATATNLPAGTYALTAVATAAGISATSAVVSVTVVNPTAVSLTTPVLSNGQVSFNYSADAGLKYVVQSTSDLTNWSSGTTNTAASSSVPFSETVVPSSRFYRVARLPNP